jgi:hypothetical protein
MGWFRKRGERERVGPKNAETCQEGEKKREVAIEIDGRKSSTPQTRDGHPLKGKKYKTTEIITTTSTNKYDPPPCSPSHRLKISDTLQTIPKRYNTT